MFKLYRDASTRYLSIRVTKWFGLKIEPTRDGERRAGLYLLAWYPQSRTRLGYASAWLTLPQLRRPCA